jgi:hypothetical protein
MPTTPLSLDTLRSFSAEVQKEAAATLPDKWTAAALMGGGAVGAHVLQKAFKDWKNGRQLRVQQSGYGGF